MPWFIQSVHQAFIFLQYSHFKELMKQKNAYRENRYRRAIGPMRGPYAVKRTYTLSMYTASNQSNHVRKYRIGFFKIIQWQFYINLTSVWHQIDVGLALDCFMEPSPELQHHGICIRGKQRNWVGFHTLIQSQSYINLTSDWCRI